jgi:hypothetical protein
VSAAFRWIRGLFEFAGAVTLLAAAGAGTLVATVATALLELAWPLAVLVFLGVALVVTSAMLTLWRAFRAVSLPTQLDDVLRDGVVLLRELPSRPAATRAGDGYSIEMHPEPVVWETARGFDERVRTLLLAEAPWLLPVYVEAANAYMTRAETTEDGGKVASPGSALKQMADREHRAPTLFVEACLDGVAAARGRLTATKRSRSRGFHMAALAVPQPTGTGAPQRGGGGVRDPSAMTIRRRVR